VKTIVFVDFDGTITMKDTCYALVETFAKEGWEEISRLWEEKKLSTTDCANALFKLIEADEGDIGKLMETIRIDEYFKEFLSLCKVKGYETYVLSDGYDFNIKAIFQRESIEAKYYSNRLVHNEGKGFSIESPYLNESCGNCGTCKTALIKKLKGEDGKVVYIGDGYSDMCPAAIADVVFAKGVLYRYCREKGIDAIHFEDFKDIMESGRI